MSSLTEAEKCYLEELLGMGGGYLLDYTYSTFGEFFKRYKIDIHGLKYQTYGTSKAKKMRAFWEKESDILVSSVLSPMLELYEANCKLNNQEIDNLVIENSRNIVARLSGKVKAEEPAQTVDDFLRREYTVPNIERLPVEASVIPVIQKRLEEALIALNAGAYLSVIFLCGSVLEAVLLGAAQEDPGRFNKARAAPKKTGDGSPKAFQDWTLAQFIDVSHEIGLLALDIKKFGHVLRDFRNYIHPYEQMASGFTPDEHTAKICLQVLKAALAGVAGER